MEQRLFVTRSSQTSSADGVCDALVRAVANIEKVSPLDLPPLTSAIDPDALERIVGSSAPEASGLRQVTFSYAGCDVSVSSDGEIVISLPATSARRARPHELDE